MNTVAKLEDVLTHYTLYGSIPADGAATIKEAIAALKVVKSEQEEPTQKPTTKKKGKVDD